MRLYLFAGWFLVLALAVPTMQQNPYPWEPTPDQPWTSDTPDSPPGWSCTPQGYIKNGERTTDHPCTCQHMGYSNGPSGEGEGCEPAHPPSTCKTYCTSQACGCPVGCVEVP